MRSVLHRPVAAPPKYRVFLSHSSTDKDFVDLSRAVDTGVWICHTAGVSFRSKTVCLFVATLAAHAGTISQSCLLLGTLDDPNYSINCQNSFGSSFASDSFGSQGKQLTGEARAMPGYTQLSVASSATFSITGMSTTAWSGAFANSFDLITINSSALDGSSGQLLLNYELDGTIVTSGAGKSIVEVAISADAEEYWTSYTSSTSGIFRVPKSFTFVFGQPFTFGICLGSLTGPGLSASGGSQPGNSHVSTFLCAPAAGPTTGSGSAAADFGLRLLPMLVTDNLGNPVLDAQFTSESGTQYNAVPEGSSFLMLGSGLITLAVLRPKRYQSTLTGLVLRQIFAPC